MRTLDLDWHVALDRLAAWSALSFEAQAFLLSDPTQEAMRSEGIPPEILGELTSGGWCELSEAGRAVRRTEAARPILVALRAMFRAPVLHDEASPQRGRGARGAASARLDNYLVEHCTEEDLQRLGNLQAEGRLHIAAKLAGSSWVLGFLHRDQPGALAGARRERYERVAPEVLELADRLIRVLLEQRSPLSLADAYEGLVEVPLSEGRLRGVFSKRRQLFSQALHFVLREALVLISLDDELRPFLGIWPPAAAAIQRRRSAEELDLVAAAEPDNKWLRPQLMDDLIALLTECASEPPRVKSSRLQLFAKAERSLAERFAPVPAWVKERSLTGEPAARVERAVGTALGLGLATAVGKPGRDLRLVPTAAARSWLSGTAASRLRALLDRFRADGAEGFWDEPMGEGEGRRGNFEQVDEMRQLTRLLPHRPSHYYLWNIDFKTPILDAFRQLPWGDEAQGSGASQRTGWTDLELFLQQRAALNPIEEQLSPEKLGWIGEQHAQRLWFLALVAFFLERLVALGGAEIGEADGRVVFRIRSAGAYLLGLSDELVWREPRHTSEVLVLPNFEVVFLTPSLEAAHEVAHFAEPSAAQRRGEAVGTLFELTRGSIQRAASAGMSADALIERLDGVTSKPLPANVEQQVRAWCAGLHWVVPERLMVLRCESAEAAAKVLAALGKHASLLSETVIALESRSLTEAQRRKLKEQGVFLREPTP